VALEYQPAVRAVRPCELPDEARFPHPGLADNGDRLPVARRCALQRLRQLLQLRITPDEAAGRARRWPGTATGQDDPFSSQTGVDTSSPFTATAPSGLTWTAFGQLQGVAGDSRGPGLCHLLRTGGEMGRLPDGGVIHVKVTADRPHDDLAGV
jgi:hypothetical protein